jgi:hypothetical protein
VLQELQLGNEGGSADWTHLALSSLQTADRRHSERGVLSTNVAWCSVALVIGGGGGVAAAALLRSSLASWPADCPGRVSSSDDSVRSASAGGEPESRVSRSWGAAGVVGGRKELKKIKTGLRLCSRLSSTQTIAKWPSCLNVP